MKVKSPKQLIIGVTGAFGSGKSTATSFFESKGYKRVYLSYYLEKEAGRKNLKLTRKVLQDLGNELRKKYGRGILMKKALEDLAGEEKVVIDGIRNVGELDIIKNKGGVVLGVIADRSTRFERIKSLKRRERLTRKLFDTLDSRDLGVGEEKTGLQGGLCLALSDVFLVNNESLEDFKIKLKKFLKEYEE